MADTVRLGLIGAGRIGTVHAENLARRVPGADLVAVADIRLEAAERCAKSLDGASAYEDHRILLDRQDVQAVLVCTSTDAHVQIVEDAARAGKHVFCEKPIDFDLARIDRALGAVEETGVKFQVGFNRRFDASFKRARELIVAGRIGEPHILRITSRDPEPPTVQYVKVSGGLFMDMTIHDWDMARYMIADEVEQIYAVGAVLVDPEIGRAGDIDTAIATLRFRRGVLGSIDNSRKAVYGYDQRVEVFGSDGVVSVSNLPRDTAVHADGGGVHGALPLYFFVERYADAYAAEIGEFVRCVAEDRPCSVTGIDGRIPVVMGHAANRSLLEQRPVRLSEVDPSMG